MPIYEYICTACGEHFEALLANDRAKPACSACQSKAVEKQLSTFSAAVAPPSAAALCSSGGCPSAGMPGSGCGTGGCPLS